LDEAFFFENKSEREHKLAGMTNVMRKSQFFSLRGHPAGRVRDDHPIG
jgi:hypothetical protein